MQTSSRTLMNSLQKYVLFAVTAVTIATACQMTCISPYCCIDYGMYCGGLVTFPQEQLPCSSHASDTHIYVSGCSLMNFNYTGALIYMPHLTHIVFTDRCPECRNYDDFKSLVLLGTTLCRKLPYARMLLLDKPLTRHNLVWPYLLAGSVAIAFVCIATAAVGYRRYRLKASLPCVACIQMDVPYTSL